MTDDYVLYQVDGPVAVVRLNRPEKLNAFTLRMVAATRAAAMRAADDPNVAGLIVTGTGRGFSAGLDAGDLTASARDGIAPRPTEGDQAKDLPALFSFLLRVPKPVIACVNGVAAGGGMVLAMMADMRFAAPEASFTTSFSRRGLIAEHATSWILPRLVGLNRALDLLWSARRFDAEEAYRVGFVDRIVPADALVDEAKAYIRELAANVSPRSMAVMKSQLYRHAGMSIDEALWETDKLVRESLAHPDATEGVASFVERRPPAFAPLERGEE